MLIDVAENNAYLDRVCTEVRQTDAAKVRWSYLWYDDEANPDQIVFFDVNGYPIECRGLDLSISQDLSILARDFGDYEINAYNGELIELASDVWRVPTEDGGEGRDDGYVEPIDPDLITSTHCKYGDTGWCQGEIAQCNQCGADVCETHYVDHSGICTGCRNEEEGSDAE
jgi:hypothetical protein